MTNIRWISTISILVAVGAALLLAQNTKIDSSKLLTGKAAFTNSVNITPGTFHKITTSDLPEPFATESARNFPTVVARPADGWPKAPAGFKVELYTGDGLKEPRQI